MAINSLIFKELVKRSYTLEGRTRVWNLADSKLWYLTPSQAQGFLDLEDNKDYKKSIIDKEISLIQKNIKGIIKNLPAKYYNIIDLGCGDGKKGALFIKEFNSENKKVRYCPIDISSYMVEKAAINTIRALKVAEMLAFKWNISDFENLINVTPLLREQNFKNHFFLLLGNTLGNFDRNDILDGICQGMGKNDLLLIGNGLKTTFQKAMLKPYEDRLLDYFLVQVLLQIGLDKKGVEYGVRFINSRVEMIYIIKKDKTVSHLGKKISFEKGDIILVAISYKYTKETFEKNLGNFFKDVFVISDSQQTYALALCKK